MHIMLLLTPFLNVTRGYLLKVITYCCKNDTYEIKFLKDKHEKRFYYFNKKSFAIYSEIKNSAFEIFNQARNVIYFQLK